MAVNPLDSKPNCTRASWSLSWSKGQSRAPGNGGMSKFLEGCWPWSNKTCFMEILLKHFGVGWLRWLSPLSLMLLLSFNRNWTWEELLSDITPTCFLFIIHTLDCRLNTNIDQTPKCPRHFLSIQSRPICLSTLHFYVLASPLTKINIRIKYQSNPNKHLSSIITWSKRFKEG